MTKQITLFHWLLCFFILQSGIANGQCIYLSGKDASHAVPWEFKISSGRNSGYWSTIPVPSNWELQGFGNYTYGNDVSDYETKPEIGYYRYNFNIPDPGKKRFRLTFQGSMTDTYVKINGKPAGNVHRGGFMEFSYDITALVKAGENLLEAEVRKSSEDPNLQRSERVTDFWLFGGIFRPVYLDVLPPEYVERVAIDAKMDGNFNMDVYLNNIRDANKLTAHIYDNSGHQVGRQLTMNLTAGDSVLRFKNNFNGIKQWSHETPALYHVRVGLYAGDRLIHAYKQKFGFRTFEVRDHDGFYLNGRRILLKGAAMHSFRPETGRALSKEDMEENIRLLKEMNCNTVRPCHYPPDTYFFDLCDSLGLLALDELTGWHNPLNTLNGSRLTREMIARDVNHPCIILWSNGNHASHNPELDNVFFRWDIQKRRPLKNAAQVETWPGGYQPAFDLVDTRYYPVYKQLTERLADNHIVLPNETLHALYDGGGAAGLFDYWEAFKSSKVGGGLIIWAFFDEGVVHTGRNNRIETVVNRAPDGLVGPHGQKEGSFYAAREIWSPVQIPVTKLSSDFNGLLKIKNDFAFINLNQCQIQWQLINFTAKHEARAGFRIIAEGVASTKDVPAGSEGNLKVNLPDNWRDCNALRLTIKDNQSNQVLIKTLKIEPSVANQHICTSAHQPITQDKTDPFLFRAGNKKLKFDETTGMLKKIWTNDQLLPLSNLPFPVAENTKGPVSFRMDQGKAELRKENDSWIIESRCCNGSLNFRWTIMAGGKLRLDYKLDLPEGQYYYAGIGMETPADKVTGKRWLGYGPYRIWKNRTQGGTLNVWDSEKQLNIPGQKWNYPEFEGFFAPWYWSVIRFGDNQNMAITAGDDNQLTLGVLNPVNGAEPGSATWHYPEKEGIYLFNCISPIGSKWERAEVFGPSSEPTKIGGALKGTVWLDFNGDQTTIDQSIFRRLIEKKLR